MIKVGLVLHTWALQEGEEPHYNTILRSYIDLPILAETRAPPTPSIRHRVGACGLLIAP
jgi:hypothetical protein